MSKHKQTKWIVELKTPTGKMKQEIFPFKPHVGQKLSDGSIVTKVN